jgi:ribonuclease HI
MERVEIFCDGACSGNPGPGGYGCIIRHNGKEKELSGGAAMTTNNKMELTGAIASLEALTVPSRVILTSDSQYLIKGMTEWIDGWQKRGWKNANKKPVLNRELWEKLIELAERHNIEWVWVRGHVGHPENERCDALARAAIEVLEIKKKSDRNKSWGKLNTD